MRVAITTIVAATALTALSTTEASAAAPASGTWTGFYGGLQVGIDSTRAKTFGQDTCDGCEGGEGFFSNNFATRHATTQFLGGGKAGFNYQVGNWVMGLEADASWVSGGTSKTAFEGADFGTDTVTSKTDGLYTVRARYGYLLGDILVFTTGGAAFSNVHFRFMGDDGANASATLTNGWTVGGGLETFITPDMSLVTEGLFVDLGSKNVTGSNSFQSVTMMAAAKQFVWHVGLNWHL